MKGFSARILLLLTFLSAPDVPAVPPTWIDIHPLVDGEEERTAEDVRRLVETTPVESVAWCCTLVPEGEPAAAKGELYAARIRRHAAALRQRTQAPWGILLQATVGHGWAPNSPTAGQKVVDVSGKEWYKFCPLGTGVVSYVAAQAKALAATRPDYFMVDDDTRLITGFGGCYCPLHLAEMRRRTGREWTRETLVAAMQTDRELAATYDVLLAESFEPLMRAIRAAFPAGTPGLFCCCNLDAHHAHRMASLLAAPGQKPVIRINNAVYMIGNKPLETPRIVSMTAREIADLRGPATVLTEADTCPHNRYSISGSAYVNQIVMTLLEGCAGAKMWVTDLSNPYERRSAEAFRGALARTKGLVEGVAALGLRRTGLVVPLPKTRPADKPLTYDPEDWSTMYLARAGLPYRFGQPRDGEVVLLSGPDLEYFTDDELGHLLAGCVLLDGGAALGLAARGFAPMIGVDVKPWTKPAVSAERFGSRIFRTAIVPAADLSVRTTGTVEHSTLLHSTSELTDDWRELAPGSVFFENARGGRVFTFAAVLPKPPAHLTQWYYYNETRKEAVVAAVRLLAGEKALPAYYAGDAEMLCETGVAADGHAVLVLDNLGIDDEDMPEIACSEIPSAVERLGDDGIWRSVAFERTQAGTVRLRSTVRTLRPAVFRSKARGLVDNAALERKLLDYVAAFNAGDDERYTNAIPNAAAADFLMRNVPLFECPDEEIERTYYYRWWSYRKHLRQVDGKTWVVSEFLPDVSWAGPGNTISCPFGHHVMEGRWLRDTRYVADYFRFMVRHRRLGPDAYANWPAWSFLAWRAVTGERGPGVTELARLRELAADWERGHVHTFRWLHGDYRAGLHADGLFHLPDNFEGTEISLGGHGAKPMVNASRCAEYRALAQLCAEAGDEATAAEYRAKSERLQKLLRERLWSEADGFYLTRNDAGELVHAPELHGYAPWYFGLDTTGQDAAWRLLAATNGFAAPYGLTFPVRSAKGFVIDRKGHGCKWNGPSWPYATSVALTAFANFLDGRASPDYFALLRQYAVQQRMRLADGRVVPWVDENLDPFTGEWLCRSMILANEKGKYWWGKERGRDYNHSTFCDLVISGLVGVRPQDGKPFALKPLVPPTWSRLRLSHLRYQGRDYTVVFDRDGTRYGLGKGWRIKEETR